MTEQLTLSPFHLHKLGKCFMEKAGTVLGLIQLSERVRVSKGTKVTQNMLCEREGKLIPAERIIYVGEQ